MATPHLLPKTAEQSSAGKQKKQARIFQARKYEVHIFRQAASLFTASAGRHSLAILLYRANLSLPAGNISPPGASRPTLSRFHSCTSRRRQPINLQMLFLQLRFFKCKNARCTFFSIQQAASPFRLDRPTSSRLTSSQSPTPPDRQHLSFRCQPANFFPPPFFLYQTHNPSPANSISSGLAGRRLTHLQPLPPTSSRSLSQRHSLPPSCCRLPNPQTKRET